MARSLIIDTLNIVRRKLGMSDMRPPPQRYVPEPEDKPPAPRAMREKRKHPNRRIPAKE